LDAYIRFADGRTLTIPDVESIDASDSKARLFRRQDTTDVLVAVIGIEPGMVTTTDDNVLPLEATA
jgi:hypothetical protein